jgi:hypothetical protein
MMMSSDDGLTWTTSETTVGAAQLTYANGLWLGVGINSESLRSGAASHAVHESAHTLYGGLDVANATITNVATPSIISDAATKGYVDLAISAVEGNSLPLAGGTMSGGIDMGSNSITNAASVGVTGAATVSGLLSANGGITVDGGMFSVADTTGNTVVGGTLSVTGAGTVTGLLSANGGITVDGGVFSVADTTGNTVVGGTLSVTGAATTGSLAVGLATAVAKVHIRQEADVDCFRVEDQASDSTYFSINSSGRVGINCGSIEAPATATKTVNIGYGSSDTGAGVSSLKMNSSDGDKLFLTWVDTGSRITQLAAWGFQFSAGNADGTAQNSGFFSWRTALAGTYGERMRLENNGQLNVMGYKIINVATPTAGTDAVNKTYADTKAVISAGTSGRVFYSDGTATGVVGHPTVTLTAGGDMSGVARLNVSGASVPLLGTPYNQVPFMLYDTNSLTYPQTVDQLSQITFASNAVVKGNGNYARLTIKNTNDTDPVFDGATMLDFDTRLGAYWQTNTWDASKGLYQGTADAAGRIEVRGEDTNNYENSSMLFYTCAESISSGSGGFGKLAERMRITSGGYVGVGTSAPAARLHLVQAIAGDSFRIDDEASDTTYFKVDQSGNVGILTGATALTSALTVAGVVNVSSNKIINLATPTASTDAASKGYVDSGLQGHGSRVAWVDPVIGNNTTAAIGGLPYATIAAAITAVNTAGAGNGAGYHIRLAPGTYSESGLTVSNGVCIRGAGAGVSIISNTSAAAGTVMMTLSSNNVIEDLTVSLTSSVSDVLKCVYFGAGSAATCSLRNVDVLMNTTAAASPSSYAIHGSGTSTPASDWFALRRVRVYLQGAGTTLNSGVCVESGCQLRMKDCVVRVTGTGTTMYALQTAGTGVLDVHGCSLDGSNKDVHNGGSGVTIDNGTTLVNSNTGTVTTTAGTYVSPRGGSLMSFGFVSNSGTALSASGVYGLPCGTMPYELFTPDIVSMFVSKATLLTNLSLFLFPALSNSQSVSVKIMVGSAPSTLADSTLSVGITGNTTTLVSTNSSSSLTIPANSYFSVVLYASTATVSLKNMRVSFTMV